jgi:threonylcarbamoyladenosine tRNA methylthiotransferase MtaB
MIMKIYLDSIGCRLNQSEIEGMARQFRLAGHEIVATAGEADLAVVNTCTVTSEAASDSRGAVRRASRLGAGEVIVTGCWATLEPQKAAGLPGVRKIVPNPKKDTLVSDLLGLPHEFFDLEPLARQPLPGLRARTRAFIKVQDGCDNRCTFCITAVARGSGRSRPIDEVVSDVQAALDGDTQEVVLTGVHLGSWGQDFEKPSRLSDLVSALLARTAVPRLRLSSLEPWDLRADFFSLWSDPRLCRHLHLPLQSGSAAVLRRMARKTTPASFNGLVEAARKSIPQVAITTDVIAGFPGETDAEFAETLDFVRRLEFAGGHVFTYSERPGTAAARMRGQVPHEVRKERNAVLRHVFADAAQNYRQQFIGQTLPVLWEATDRLDSAGWRLEGLTDNYLRVSAIASEPRWNRIDKVTLTKMADDALEGTIANVT